MSERTVGSRSARHRTPLEVSVRRLAAESGSKRVRAQLRSLDDGGMAADPWSKRPC